MYFKSLTTCKYEWNCSGEGTKPSTHAHTLASKVATWLAYWHWWEKPCDDTKSVQASFSASYVLTLTS